MMKTPIVPFHLLAASALLAVASGCSKPPEKAILGTWSIDDLATIETLTNGPERSERMMAASSMTHTYTFGEDQSVSVAYSYGMDSWERTGTWSVGNADGNRQYYRIESGQADADWRDYSVYLRDGVLTVPFPDGSDEIATMKAD
jgi:hypothetical protein